MTSAAVSDGLVYVGISDNVYALNSTTGSQIWDFPTQNQINSSPAVFNGVIYIGSQDGNFYAIGKPLTSPSPLMSLLNALFIIVGVVAAVVIAVVIVLLIFKKELKNKPKS